MKEEFLNVISQTLGTQWFYLAIATAILIEILRSLWSWESYVNDCKMLNMEVKKKGYIRNTIDNIILICIIVIIGFFGYFKILNIKDKPEPKRELIAIQEAEAEAVTKKQSQKYIQAIQETYQKKRKPLLQQIEPTTSERKKYQKTSIENHHLKNEIARLKRENKKWKKYYYDAIRKKPKEKKPCKKTEVISMRDGKIFKREWKCKEEER